MRTKTKLWITFSKDHFIYTRKPIKGWKHIAITKVWLVDGNINNAEQICYFHFCKGMKFFEMA